MGTFVQRVGGARKGSGWARADPGFARGNARRGLDLPGSLARSPALGLGGRAASPVWRSVV